MLSCSFLVKTVSDINRHFCGSAERDRTSPFSNILVVNINLFFTSTNSQYVIMCSFHTTCRDICIGEAEGALPPLSFFDNPKRSKICYVARGAKIESKIDFWIFLKPFFGCFVRYLDL